MTDAQRARIEEFTRFFTSKAKVGMVDKDLLKYLNLDLGSIHAYSIKGELEKDPSKPEGAEFNYMVNSIGLYACAGRDVEVAFEECEYGDYVQITLAPNSLIVLDIVKL
jgi:hypothetical protein